jgi:XTP/dITP diphosphohydrolase
MAESSTTPELWIATTNRGKVLEFEMILEPLVKAGLKLQTLADLDTYYPPEETGATFLDNARIKARSLKAMKPGTWIVAEDSGLVVEGLNGLPGVHSARYAGPKASDFENRVKLLKIMGLKMLSNRNAAFICQMVAFDPAGQEHLFDGRLEGAIPKSEAGKNGFGYDSVFVPQGETKTLADLGLAFKNKVSHRARAVDQLHRLLATRMGLG